MWGNVDEDSLMHGWIMNNENKGTYYITGYDEVGKTDGAFVVLSLDQNAMMNSNHWKCGIFSHWGKNVCP